MLTRPRTMLCVSLTLCLCAGCGSGDGIKRVPITGLVTVQGTPLPGATLSFRPAGGTGGPGALGRSDEKGKFQVISSREGHEGIPPGKYTVRVSRIVMPDGTTLPPTEPPADHPDSRQSVPAPYSGTNSPLTVEVPKDGGKIEVNIPAKLVIPLKNAVPSQPD